MRDLFQDFVHAGRRLRGSPAFTLFSVLTLALGIGATTAIYSAVHAAFLRPLVLGEPDRVARLYHADPRRGGSLPTLSLSGPDYLDYRAAQRSFAHLAAWSRFRHSLVVGETAEIISGEMVGGDYFAVVGLPPIIGRTLLPADDRPGAPRVMVIGERFWRSRFGGAPDVVGRTVNLGGDTFEIVGVMPAAFRGLDAPNVMPTPAWVPLSSTRSPNGDGMADRGRRWLRAVGRLAPGVTFEAAQAEFRAIGERLDAAHPPVRRGAASPTQSRRWFLMPAREVRLHESVDAVAGPLVSAILGTVALVLMVACTNLANLTLARGSARRHENAVRVALGASRWRVLRAHLVESILVAAAGGVLAVGIAKVVMVTLLSARLDLAPGFAVDFAPDFNAAVAGIAAAATLLALVVSGLLPAWHAARTDVRQALAQDATGTAAGRWRTRRILIAGQVAVSASLVALAILSVQQIRAMAQRDVGIDVDRLAVASVDFRLQRKDEAHGRRVIAEALHAARLQPGVDAVAASSGLPYGIGTPGAIVATEYAETDGYPRGVVVEYVASTPAIFDVLGVSVQRGRAFTDGDTAASTAVAVLSAKAAADLFGESDPIGRRFVATRRRWVGEAAHQPVVLTVVGVARNTLTTGSGAQHPVGVVYVPLAQRYEPGLTISVRAAGDPAALPDRLRNVIQQADPSTAVLQAATGRQLASGTQVLTVGAYASSLLGGLAMLLAMAGLYGVMADLVTRRTREIGIRLALGAERSALLRMILADGARPVLLGLALGVGAGVLARMAFRPLFLRMLPAFDPLVAAGVAAAFLLAGLSASWFPARRAANVDPNTALRHL